LSAVEITAVICTHNRASYLERCIRSVLDQKLAGPSFELLVVNNASTDNTPDVCGRFAAGESFRVIDEPVAGLSRARNRGWQEARGRYVGYLDDDAVAVAGWLQGVKDAFGADDPAPEWVGGPIELEWEAASPGWIDAELRVSLGEVDLGATPRFLAPGERLGGGNSFYQRRVLEELGGFNERLGRRRGALLSAEETDLQHRLQAAGGRLYYHPAVKILHHVPRERLLPSYFYRRYYWGGRSDRTMAQSLAGMAYQPLELESRKGSRLLRLAGNFSRAAGFAARAERIRARVYIAYVCGWVVQSMMGSGGNGR
jgi:glycosyltransferase involved in cell wall biosynthesis